MDKAAAMLSDYNFAISLSIEEGETHQPNWPGTIRVELLRVIPPVVRGIVVFAVPAL